MTKKTTRKTRRRKAPDLKLASEAPQGPFSPVADAVDAVRDGKMIIVVDDEDRENEGDLTVAAEKTTPEIINFMAKYGRGLICLPMTGERLEELDIPLMVSENTSQFDTAFCVSVEAKESTSTGISAADPLRLGWRRTRRRFRQTWLVRGTCSPYGRGRVGSWCEPVRPRQRLIWQGSPVYSRLALFAKS